MRDACITPKDILVNDLDLSLMSLRVLNVIKRVNGDRISRDRKNHVVFGQKRLFLRFFMLFYVFYYHGDVYFEFLQKISSSQERVLFARYEMFAQGTFFNKNNNNYS